MVKTIIALLLISAPASADTPKWMWSVGPILRIVSADGRAGEDMRQLEAYGWTPHDAPALGVHGDAEYLQAPLVDAGITWTWLHDTFATGPAFQDPDHITGSSLEMGAMLRLHWVRRDAVVAAEPRIEAGLARTTVKLRGVGDATVNPYTRIGVDFRLGGRRAGVLVTVDDTAVHSDAMVPTGGLTWGVSFYWREWTSQ